MLQILPEDAFGDPLYAYIYSTGMNITIPSETLALISAWTAGPSYREGFVSVTTTARDLVIGGVAPIGEDPQTDTSTRTFSYRNTVAFSSFFAGNPADAATPGLVTAPGTYSPGYPAWYGPARRVSGTATGCCTPDRRRSPSPGSMAA